MTTEQVEAAVKEQDDVEVEADEHAAPPAEDRPARSGASGWWRWALLGIAFVLAVSGSLAWWQSAHDDGISAAHSRDAVLLQTRQAISTMNTLDYRKVDAGVKAWAGVTTGTLHDQLAGVSAKDRKLLAEQKKISTGRVVDAAVVELDGRSATVIAAVEVTVRDAAKPGSEPTVKRNRFTADVLEVGGRWKLESLEQVAVNLS